MTPEFLDVGSIPLGIENGEVRDVGSIDAEVVETQHLVVGGGGGEVGTEGVGKKSGTSAAGGEGENVGLGRHGGSITWRVGEITIINFYITNGRR